MTKNLFEIVIASPQLQNNLIANNSSSGIVLATFSEAQPNEETTASFGRRD